MRTPPTRPDDDTAMQPLKVADHIARRLVIHKLSRMAHGSIRLLDSTGEVRLGAGPEAAAVRVLDGRFYRNVVFGGSLGAAESYLQGHWQCTDLTSLMRYFAQNREATSWLDRGVARLQQLVMRYAHWRRSNTRARSRQNISDHYDLGNDFFQSWLDDTLAYSCAVFPSWQCDLQVASQEKFDRVCRKLDIAPGDHILEVGTGWGGFALHAARNYGCQVTTTTISRAQYSLATRRVADARLADKITVLDQDYRDLQGQYDKVVSLEMVEAVGPQYLGTFFAKIGRLLKPSGALLLQGIVMPERNYQAYLRSVDFVRKYVFPGGSLPSLAGLIESANHFGMLRCVHCEELAPHYAETLRRWRARFEAQFDVFRAQGYTERLLRMWRYYLCYCEAGFEERHVSVVQLVFDGPASRSDPVSLSRRAAQSRGQYASPRAQVPPSTSISTAKP